MSVLISNLNMIESIKLDIASAIEAKGVSMSGVSFPDYPSAIASISGGGSGYTEAEMTEGVAVNLSNNASYVGSYAFYMNGNIQTAYLPSCSYVGRSAFAYASIVSVNLPVCESVSYGGFSHCFSLTQVSLPLCGYIPDYAFNDCRSLPEINLPVCSCIGQSAFQWCSKLSSVILPMVTKIEQRAFESCSMLSQITLGASSVCSISNITPFLSTPIASGSGLIYVPASLVSDYQTATYWQFYSSHIVSIPE